MAVQEVMVAATGSVTMAATDVATNTVTIGGVVYTLRAAVGATASEIQTSTSQTTMATRLANAINDAFPGAENANGYGSATVQNPYVKASAAGAVVSLTARLPGAISNFVTLAETLTGGTVSGATLTTGSGDLQLYLEQLLDLNQINAEVQTEIHKLTSRAD